MMPRLAHTIIKLAKHRVSTRLDLARRRWAQERRWEG